MTKEFLYEIVTNDRMELPVWVGNMFELMQYTGRTSESIRTGLCHSKLYKKHNSDYKIVKIGWCDIEKAEVN